ncbi:MAG: MBL fold metallo-hydrolase [Limnobacter sp.]|nr:MBL fold metallo-hydrolase [Limnobacter sp.]
MQGCSTPNPYYNPNRAHHRPDGFVNSDGSVISKSLPDLIRWYRERFGLSLPPPPGESYASYAAFPQQAFNKAQLPRNVRSVTWLGHATVLLKLQHITVLTDPHFSERAFPVQWAGPQRKVKAPAQVADLPPIDVVVLSHNHYDHTDKTTLLELANAQPHTLFLVPLGLEKTLQDWGIDRVKALDWWNTIELANTELTLVPAHHWSARSFFDRNTTLWGGWVVKEPGFSFFFSGDTGYSQDFQEIGRRLGPFNLSAIAVGAYEPRWFMKAQHINPEEAVRVHQEVGSALSIGVHWGTFELTDEALDKPVEDLKKAKAKLGVADSAFRLLAQGQTVALGP